MNPLQELIQSRLAERRWSYAEAARRCNLPRSTVYNLATSETLQRPPQRATLDALAQGLDLPVGVVNAAASAAAGLSGGDGRVLPDVAALVADLETLSPADRGHVAALVESLLRRSSRDSAARRR